jgi:hypothetical protein
MLLTQCALGFIPHSKVRKMDFSKRRPIAISYNLIFEWLGENMVKYTIKNSSKRTIKKWSNF